eukprot:5870698-Alexandrium_andersonii.AAC.1
MSASLVGSEMCIRDRSREAPRAWPKVPCTLRSSWVSPRSISGSSPKDLGLLILLAPARGSSLKRDALSTIDANNS